jgi:hypothetical protein
MIRLNRSIVTIKKMGQDDDDDGYVDASIEECFGYVWELTLQIWSFKDKNHAERRLQRNITNLIKS